MIFKHGGSRLLLCSNSRCAGAGNRAPHFVQCHSIFFLRLAMDTEPHFMQQFLSRVALSVMWHLLTQIPVWQVKTLLDVDYGTPWHSHDFCNLFVWHLCLKQSNELVFIIHDIYFSVIKLKRIPSLSNLVRGNTKIMCDEFQFDTIIIHARQNFFIQLNQRSSCHYITCDYYRNSSCVETNHLECSFA